MSDATETGSISCEGVKTADWYAWNDRMPGTQPSFHMTGEVLAPNPGVQAILVRRQHQVSPSQIQLSLILYQRPGIWPPVLTWVQARFDKVLLGPGYEQAQVYCGDDLIADVEVKNVS